jgi:hypothetical protein
MVHHELLYVEGWRLESVDSLQKINWAGTDKRSWITGLTIVQKALSVKQIPVVAFLMIKNYNG